MERTWEAVRNAGGDARTFGAARLAAIGPATAKALERHGLHADVAAKEFRGEGLAQAMLEALGGQGPRGCSSRGPPRRGTSCPMPCAPPGARWTSSPPTRRTRAPKAAMGMIAAELEAGGIDAALFTSSSTAEQPVRRTRRAGGHAPGPDARVACIGPVTSAAARGRGVRVDVEATEYTLPGLIRALAESYAKPVA